ncbi:MAG: stage II sporulation protein D [Bacillota bacterium]|nr:stage II sporulation protein D [Bacillota bacterium]
MKKVVGVALLLALVLFLIPLGIRHDQKTQTEGSSQPLTLPDSGRTLNILVDGQVQTMDLNEYLWGVVAAEMPASFEEEALKAQAVAARTYSLHKAGNAVNHPEADLCTNYACCQAWISREKAQANWGENAAVYTDKITQAVAETNNEVVLYDGQLISAVFHSSSGAATQDAVAVWGNSVPYLQSVDSPEGEEVPNFHSQVTFTAQEFKDTYLAAQPEAVLEGEPANWFGETTLTNGGSVGTIVIGGVSVTGAQARQIFGLRSAAFTVETTADSVTFQVTGFGHGVGMSQYGANAMAADGSTYTEILQHYYTGVTVEEYAG